MEILTASTDKFTMNCVRFGKGQKQMVILPGMSIKSVILSAKAVEAAFAMFASDYTVYLFDRKENISSPYSVNDMAEDTYRAMQVFGVTNAYVFGASQGGMMALTLAIHHPDAVAKLFLGSTLSRQNDISRNTFSEWKALSEKGVARPLVSDMVKRVYSPEYNEKYKSAIDAMLDDATDEELKRFAVLSKASLDFDVYGELDRISCPVTVVGSDRDNVLSGNASHEIAEKLCCPIYMYSGYSHAVYDEAEDYKERILKFFAE